MDIREGLKVWIWEFAGWGVGGMNWNMWLAIRSNMVAGDLKKLWEKEWLVVYARGT